MEYDKALLTEFVGKKIIVITHYGIGTKEDMAPGNYKGVLLAFDNNFVKIEYDVKRFVEGATRFSKEIILINLSYIISIEPYQENADA